MNVHFAALYAAAFGVGAVAAILLAVFRPEARGRLLLSRNIVAGAIAIALGVFWEQLGAVVATSLAIAFALLLAAAHSDDD